MSDLALQFGDQVPKGTGSTSRGSNTNTSIAGLDTRVFRVLLSTDTAVELPTLAPPRTPRSIGLTFPTTASVRESLLLRPTFRQHFDTVVVDWRYIEEQTPEA